MSSGDESQQGGGQAEPQNGVPNAVPPSFGASTDPQPAATSQPLPPAPEPAVTPDPVFDRPGPPAAPPPPPEAPAPSEPTVGWYASAGPYAATGANARQRKTGPAGKANPKSTRLPSWGNRGSTRTWGSNRSRLVNATLFGAAPLALAGIVAAAFVLASPGKGQASSHSGFQAAAGPSAQQQSQGNGSTSPVAPSPSKSGSQRPGKRSTMPDGKPSPSQSATTSKAGHSPGSAPKSQPAKKKKPKPAGPVTPANLGIPNFDGYCGHIGEGSAVTTNNTAYGWACSVNPSLPMAIQNACGWTYHLSLSKIINVSVNYHDPNAWQCWRTNGIIGQLNIAAYCSDAGLGAAKLSTADAYGWTCAGQPIDTNAACQLVDHNGNAFSRFAVFQDPYSWQCWD